MSITIELEKRKIKISTGVMNLMNSYKQLNHNDYEAGGLLIGRENKSTDNIIIEYATGPYHKDKRTRSSFYRKDKAHIEFYNELYKESGGIYAYIGEWHTHPEDYPNVSCLDKRNWKKISKLNKNRKRKYYHIIIGNEEIRMWEYSFVLKQAKRVL